jgi:hypothetical protein
VITSDDGVLYRRRYHCDDHAVVHPVLPFAFDSCDGYCLLLCRDESGLFDGFRGVEFSPLMEEVRDERAAKSVEKRKREQGKMWRAPCTCHANFGNCDGRDCSCKKAGKKCKAECHGIDHSSCLNSSAHNKKKKGNGNAGQQPIARNDEAHNDFDVEVEEHVDYEVESIIDQRAHPTNKDETEYLVRWKGYAEEDDTWVSASDASKSINLIIAFERRRANEAANTMRARGEEAGTLPDVVVQR